MELTTPLHKKFLLKLQRWPRFFKNCTAMGEEEEEEEVDFTVMDRMKDTITKIHCQ
jgi:hypothetical protein